MLPIISDRKIRVGLVGCGRISKNHFSSISQFTDDLELSAVCDSDADVLASHASEHTVPGYSNLTEMLAREALDLVVLATPSGR